MKTTQDLFRRYGNHMDQGKSIAPAQKAEGKKAGAIRALGGRKRGRTQQIGRFAKPVRIRAVETVS